MKNNALNFKRFEASKVRNYAESLRLEGYDLAQAKKVNNSKVLARLEELTKLNA
ncbi:YhfG family protein [Shewanella sp.]|uniref:YhfG family protein n=1 Tax=Shewanella sp. TaxID=50422 RepID=UPI00356AE39E